MLGKKQTVIFWKNSPGLMIEEKHTVFQKASSSAVIVNALKGNKDYIFLWIKITVGVFRSSRSQIFFKIGALKNFGKQLCWSLFLIKLQAKVFNLIKKKFQHKCFPVNIAKF